MRVFISHSSNDKKFVRYLKQCLNLNGINTWFDEDQLLLGDSLEEKLKKSVKNSSHFLIVLSQSSVASKWVNQELEVAMANLDHGIIEKIIPVKLMECEIPLFLSELVYFNLSSAIRLPKKNSIKFLDDSYERFFVKLVQTIRDPYRVIDKKDKEKLIESINRKASTKNNTKAKSINNYAEKEQILLLDQIEQAIFYYKNLNLRENGTIKMTEIAQYLIDQKIIKANSADVGRIKLYNRILRDGYSLKSLLETPEHEMKWQEARKLRAIQKLIK